MRAARYLLIGGLGVGAVAIAIAALPSTASPPSRGPRPAAAPAAATATTAATAATAATATTGEPSLSARDPVAPAAERPPSRGPREQLASALSGHREPVPPGRVVELIEHGLASTGESAEPWTRDAERTFAGLRRELHGALPGDRLRITEPRCFAAGCVIAIEYPPGTDIATLADSLLATQVITDWPGGKLLSPVVPGGPGGAATAQRWVLLRPDAL
jgi:hypothetical protein